MTPAYSLSQEVVEELKAQEFDDAVADSLKALILSGVRRANDELDDFRSDFRDVGRDIIMDIITVGRISSGQVSELEGLSQDINLIERRVDRLEMLNTIWKIIK